MKLFHFFYRTLEKLSFFFCACPTQTRETTTRQVIHIGFHSNRKLKFFHILYGYGSESIGGLGLKCPSEKVCSVKVSLPRSVFFCVVPMCRILIHYADKVVGIMFSSTTWIIEKPRLLIFFLCFTLISDSKLTRSVNELVEQGYSCYKLIQSCADN